MHKSAYIIVGLGYGDEGKGLVTDYFCKKSKQAIVIRFNGGQQAGHTVFLKSGRKHIFSNFGAGTLRGIPTFWSRYCTFSPGFFLEEMSLLRLTPKFFIDGSCPVTTHYDILYNRLIEKFRGNNKYGSCGLGVGATINRHKELPVKLTVYDLLKKPICLKKLSAIKEYYKKKIQTETNFLFSVFDHDNEDAVFMGLLNKIQLLVSKRVMVFTNEKYIFSNKSVWQTYIFEGAQGVLLDVKYGQWPFVTKSNTTSKNALEILNRNFGKSNIETNIVYVTRTYHTRHGEGPFRNSTLSLSLRRSSHETNVLNEFQGKFRVSPLDTDLLNYAIKCDQTHSKKLPKHLFITCLDQLAHRKIPIYAQNRKRYVAFEAIQDLIDCNLETIHYSFSRFTEELK